MTNRLIIPLLCAASVVAFARGNVSHKATLAASTTEKHSKVALSSKFTVKAGQLVEFTLDVRNNTPKMVELRFPTGKTHDFIVRDESGKIRRVELRALEARRRADDARGPAEWWDSDFPELRGPSS